MMTIKEGAQIVPHNHSDYVNVRSMNYRRSTSHFGKFQMAISLQRVTPSTPCAYSHYAFPRTLYITVIHHCWIYWWEIGDL